MDERTIHSLCHSHQKSLPTIYPHAELPMSGMAIQTPGTQSSADRAFLASARNTRYSLQPSATFQEGEVILNDHAATRCFNHVSRTNYPPSNKTEDSMTSLSIGDMLRNLGDSYETGPEGPVTKVDASEDLFGNCQTQPPLPPFNAFYISNPYDSFHGA